MVVEIDPYTIFCSPRAHCSVRFSSLIPSHQCCRDYSVHIMVRVIDDVRENARQWKQAGFANATGPSWSIQCPNVFTRCVKSLLVKFFSPFLRPSSYWRLCVRDRWGIENVYRIIEQPSRARVLCAYIILSLRSFFRDPKN